MIGVEDKLSPDQRIRLESLNLALVNRYDDKAEDVVARAKTFEKFVKGSRTTVSEA